MLLLLGTGTTVCFGLLLRGGTGVLGPTQAICLMVGFLDVLVARHAEPGVLLAAVFVTSTAVGLVKATEIPLRETPSRARKTVWGGTRATQAHGRRAYWWSPSVRLTEPAAEEDEETNGASPLVENDGAVHDVIEHALLREDLKARAVESGEENREVSVPILTRSEEALAVVGPAGRTKPKG